MAYHKARNCFEENLRLLDDATHDPQAWNLNCGLHELTNAIESDMAQIQSTLDVILRTLSAR